MDRRIVKLFMQSYWSALQFAPTNLLVFLPWYATGLPRKTRFISHLRFLLQLHIGNKMLISVKVESD